MDALPLLNVTAPATMALNRFSNLFNLNETLMAEINNQSDACGYTQFMEKALTFPPGGPLPTAPSSDLPGCAIWNDVVTAALYVNPCFNINHLTDYCPYLWDQLGKVTRLCESTRLILTTTRLSVSRVGTQRLLQPQRCPSRTPRPTDGLQRLRRRHTIPGG